MFTSKQEQDLGQGTEHDEETSPHLLAQLSKTGGSGLWLRLGVVED